MKKYLALLLVTATIFLTTSVKAAEAGPMYTLTPATGTYANGSEFVVTIGVESGAEKVFTADVYGTYDAAKLELLEIKPVNDPAIEFDASQTGFQPRFFNDTGKFEIPLAPLSMNIHDAKTAKGPLVTLRFKAKAPGTATVAYTCTQGELVDSNLVNSDTKDVLDCASNQSGSYTITAVGGDDGTASTPVPTTADTSGTLPETGSVTTTIGLLVVGIAGMAGAFMLRLL